MQKLRILASGIVFIVGVIVSWYVSFETPQYYRSTGCPDGVKVCAVQYIQGSGWLLWLLFFLLVLSAAVIAWVVFIISGGLDEET